MKHCDDMDLKRCFEQANMRIKTNKPNFTRKAKENILSVKIFFFFIFFLSQDHEFSESAFKTSMQLFIFIKIILQFSEPVKRVGIGIG